MGACPTPYSPATNPGANALPAARKDGTVFWQTCMCNPLKQDNRPNPLGAVITDVTDHLELHEALRQSEAQHRLLAGEHTSGPYHGSPRRRPLPFRLPSSRTMLAMDRKELVGNPLRLILHHGDRAAARRIFENHFSGRSESICRSPRGDAKTGRTCGPRQPVKRVGKPAVRDQPRSFRSPAIFRDGGRPRTKLRAMHNLLDAVYRSSAGRPCAC